MRWSWDYSLSFSFASLQKKLIKGGTYADMPRTSQSHWHILAHTDTHRPSRKALEIFPNPPQACLEGDRSVGAQAVGVLGKKADLEAFCA